MKNIQTETPSQQKPQHTAQNIGSYALTLKPKARRAFFKVVALCYQRHVNYFSQEWLGKQVGISRTYCNEIINFLESVGLICKDYYHRHTSHYWLPDYFYKKEFRLYMLHFMAYWGVYTLQLLSSKPALAEAPTPPILMFIYKQPGSLLRGFEQRACARENQATSSQEKRKDRMQAHQVSDFIKNIRSIELTEAGQIELSRFSDAVLREALAKLQAKKNPQDPFRYLFFLAKDISQQKGIEVQHAGANQLLVERGINFDDPKYVPRNSHQRESTHAKNNQQPSSVSDQAAKPVQEKVARKRSNWGSHWSGEFLTIKCAEYNLDYKILTPGWVEWCIRDELEAKGYSKQQQDKDLDEYYAGVIEESKRIAASVPEEKLRDFCMKKITEGFLKRI